MHEDLAAVAAGEKAVPLVGVIPLDLAGRHAQTSRRRELDNNQRSCDRQDALGISKAIGPGRRIAASLSPGLRVLPVSRNYCTFMRVRRPRRIMQTARGEPRAV